jgi:hypothetical protein
MVGLALAICLPIVFLQLYKIYVGPISFDAQVAVVLVSSLISGLVLYRAFRSSARNQN